MTGLGNDSKSGGNIVETPSPLEEYTKLQSLAVSSAPSKDSFLDTVARRLERFELQEAARKLLPDERVSACLRMFGFGKRVVEVWHSQQAQVAHYKGLAVCGSVWTCPVCASKISERRREELKAALAVTRYHRTLVTVTLQHNQGDDLTSVLSVLREGWQKTKAGKGWQVLKSHFGLVGSITALECTHGGYGWHPHLHVLMFSERELLDVDREEFQAAVTSRFGGYVAGLGGYVSSIYGVQVSGPEAAGDYVAKWGEAEEMTKAVVKKSKKGRNPFDLLRDYVKGDEHAGSLFVEYAQAMKGRHQLSWARGLRDLLGLGREAKDEDLAQEQVSKGDMLLALIDHQGWQVILKNNLRGALLEIAASGDVDLLGRWLFDHGVVAHSPKRHDAA